MKTKISVISSMYNCEHYLSLFLEHLSRVDNREECEFLLLHNDPKIEEYRLIEPYLTLIPQIVYVPIQEREGLYATWNRGVKMAKGSYVAVWNVDDVRTASSLRLQAETLDRNPNAGIAYGNFTLVEKFGSYSGILVEEPNYHPMDLRFRYDHKIGPFPMWRRSLHDKVGYFDEQFRLVGDLDFQIRSTYKVDLVKCDEMLGYFLIAEANRLSNNSQLQARENLVVDIRYANYYKLNWWYLHQISSYNFYELLQFNIHSPLKIYLGHQLFWMNYRLPFLILSLFLQPRFFLLKYRVRRQIKQWMKLLK